MSDPGHDSDARARATWLRARRQWGGPVTALELGDTASAVALGASSAPERVIRLDLGVVELARRHFHAPRPGESAIEAAIAEVEELIMPLRPLVPRDSRCVTADPRVIRIAEALGVTRGAGACLGTDAVEHGFNRWVSIALGRPATQDTIPLDADFAASLLVLREWLHHLSFDNIHVSTRGTDSDPAPGLASPGCQR
jgi:hypothetical protein